MAKLLSTQNLSIGYGKKIIQHNLNLSVDRGALISLIGTNGAGKSTLLRTISALQPALSGTIEIEGTDISQLSTHRRAQLLAIVLTEKIEIDNLSVRQLVSMGRFPYTNWVGNLSDKDNSIIDKAISDVNLTHKADADINHISDGEKQRAVIAKALAQDTPLILLDEPTAHLDLPNRIETMMLLQRLAVTTNKTFILSSHELDLALQISNQIWLMTTNGIEVGIPEDLILNGSFPRAFVSNNYTFDMSDGRCIINNLYGNSSVTVTGDDNSIYQQIWLKRALMRVGIKVSDKANTTLHCTAQGYNVTTEGTKYPTIELLLNHLNTIEL